MLEDEDGLPDSKEQFRYRHVIREQLEEAKRTKNVTRNEEFA